MDNQSEQNLKQEEAESKNKNQLYPVFLKLEQLRVLLVGAGNVALEKAHSLLANSPAAAITVIAPEIKDEMKQLIDMHPKCKIIQRKFTDADLTGQDIIMLATDDRELHRQIKLSANGMGLLVNAADTPDLCDFYLGSIVQKGYLKLAISTNGMSPTIAKRIKEVLNDVLPEELDEVIENLNQIRNTLTEDFAGKVKHLNELTKQLTTRK